MEGRVMSRKIVLWLLIVQLCCPSRGESSLSSSIRPAEPNEFPFQVSIRDLKKDVFLCSGVLITNRTVLTTASCIPDDTLVKVSAGSIYRKKQNRTVNFAEKIIHSKYNQSQLTNDIALIRLADPFKLDEYVYPARIPSAATHLVNDTTITGWNVLDLEDSLKVCENYTIWHDCRGVYNLKREFGPDVFCGDYVLGPDHGNLISKDGVVYGLGTDSLMLGKLHSFVEVSYHANWIRENLKEEAGHVMWHERNEAGTQSNCLAAILLFALFLCQ